MRERRTECLFVSSKLYLTLMLTDRKLSEKEFIDNELELNLL